MADTIDQMAGAPEPLGPDPTAVVEPRRLVPTARQAARGDIEPVAISADQLSQQSQGSLPASPVARRPRGERFANALRDVDPRRLRGPKLPVVVFTTVAMSAGLGGAVFAVIQPELSAEFAASGNVLLAVGNLGSALIAALGLLYGWLADRYNRTWMFRIGAIASGLIGILVATAGGFLSLICLNLLRAGVGSMQPAAQATMLPDIYDDEDQAKIFSIVPAFQQMGAILAPLAAGFVIVAFGFRFALAASAALFTVVALSSFLLREPPRKGINKQPPPPFMEGMRAVGAISTVKNIWYATGFLAMVTGQFSTAVGVPIFFVLYWAEVFNASFRQIGLCASLLSAVNVVTLLAWGRVAERLIRHRPGRILAIVGSLMMLQVIPLLVLVGSPVFVVSLLAALPLTMTISVLEPAVGLIMNKVLPARVRGLGAASRQPWAIGGALGFSILLLGNFIRGPAGARLYPVALLPFVLLGGYFLIRASTAVERDGRAAEFADSAEAASVEAKQQGRSKMVICRGVDSAYSGVQVLFGVDFDVDEGEIVALLGTNGAGKSTLMRAIAGTQPASGGAILLDGRDITREPPHLNAAAGLVMLPGGAAVFPALSVRENLKAATWLYRDDPAYLEARMEEVLDFFPILRERWEQIAGNLSGGEQQMVALGQAFLMKPRLLMIDELSLGLAPAVVAKLLGIVRAIHAQGTTVVLIEQSLNVALTIADRAVFMDKGEIRFDGPTDELLKRPDLVRAVFMGGGTGGRRVARATGGRDGSRAGNAFLEVDDATVRFGGITALSGVSLGVHEGEVVGVIGPNGAGKTTLFDAISGFVPLAEGRIVLEGVDASGMSPDARARLGLARSFQSAALFQSLTVRENIAVALERRAVKNPILAALWTPGVRKGEAKILARVDGLIEVFGLEAYADKFVSDLSTGTRRAVDMACVMAAEPRVLLLDEPSSGLAQGETEELGPLLVRVVRETGCGMLIIEHDVALVSAVSDRLIALETGTLVVSGSPDEVRRHPRVLASYLAATEDAGAAAANSRMGTIADALLTPSDATQNPNQGSE